MTTDYIAPALNDGTYICSKCLIGNSAAINRIATATIFTTGNTKKNCESENKCNDQCLFHIAGILNKTSDSKLRE
jgi:hypothetical protein